MAEGARYWLSFDLGLRGDYNKLYGWLDRHEAKECGDNVATFRSAKSMNEIAKEIKGLLDPAKNARVYCIDRKHGGSWISGKRQVAPWIGYGQVTLEGGNEKDE